MRKPKIDQRFGHTEGAEISLIALTQDTQRVMQEATKELNKRIRAAFRTAKKEGIAINGLSVQPVMEHHKPYMRLSLYASGTRPAAPAV